MSSSVEVEKMKIERFEAEGTHMADLETISKLGGKNVTGSEQRSWWPVMTLLSC